MTNVINFFISSLWRNYFKFLHHLSPYFATKTMEIEHILMPLLTIHLFLKSIPCNQDSVWTYSTEWVYWILYWNYSLPTTTDLLITNHALLLEISPHLSSRLYSTIIIHLFFPNIPWLSLVLVPPPLSIFNRNLSYQRCVLFLVLSALYQLTSCILKIFDYPLCWDASGIWNS